MVKRYRTSFWTRVRERDSSLDSGFAKHLREVARDCQIAFQRLMTATDGNPIGIECKSSNRDAWAFVAVEVSDTDYPYRIQNFDEDGFVGHNCYKSLEEATETLLRDGYRTVDQGALDRLTTTERWIKGVKRSEIRTLFNRGLISMNEMFDRMSKVTA